MPTEVSAVPAPRFFILANSHDFGASAKLGAEIMLLVFRMTARAKPEYEDVNMSELPAKSRGTPVRFNWSWAPQEIPSEFHPRGIVAYAPSVIIRNPSPRYEFTRPGLSLRNSPVAHFVAEVGYAICNIVVLDKTADDLASLKARISTVNRVKSAPFRRKTKVVWPRRFLVPSVEGR
jgi:hypothetical protein